METQDLEIYITGPKTSDVQIFVGDLFVRYVQGFSFESTAESNLSHLNFTMPAFDLKKRNKPEVKKDTMKIVLKNAVRPKTLSDVATKIFVGEEQVGSIKEINFDVSTVHENHTLNVIATKTSAEFPEWVNLTVEPVESCFDNETQVLFQIHNKGFDKDKSYVVYEPETTNFYCFLNDTDTFIWPRFEGANKYEKEQNLVSPEELLQFAENNDVESCDDPKALRLGFVHYDHTHKKIIIKKSKLADLRGLEEIGSPSIKTRLLEISKEKREQNSKLISEVKERILEA